MKKFMGLLVLVSAMAMTQSAFALGPDFSTLTSAVDFGTVKDAVMGIFAALAVVFIVMRGGEMILGKIRR